MITYEPVWISTDDHLKKLYAIYNHASLSEKMFAAYKLPSSFPCIQMSRWLLPSKRIPVVAIASGIGKIDNNRFSFQSRPFHIFGSETKNLIDLEFEINRNEMVQVARDTAESPVLRYYNIPFIRVETRRDGLFNNFLVCVGGVGPSMAKINAQSNELLQNLNKLIAMEGI